MDGMGAPPSRPGTHSAPENGTLHRSVYRYTKVELPYSRQLRCTYKGHVLSFAEAGCMPALRCISLYVIPVPCISLYPPFRRWPQITQIFKHGEFRCGLGSSTGAICLPGSIKPMATAARRRLIDLVSSSNGFPSSTARAFKLDCHGFSAHALRSWDKILHRLSSAIPIEF